MVNYNPEKSQLQQKIMYIITSAMVTLLDNSKTRFSELEIHLFKALLLNQFLKHN